MINPSGLACRATPIRHSERLIAGHCRVKRHAACARFNGPIDAAQAQADAIEDLTQADSPGARERVDTAREQHGEFVAAQPRCNLPGLKLGSQEIGEFAQDHITRSMPDPIVDGPETVQIDVDQNRGVLLCPGDG